MSVFTFVLAGVALTVVAPLWIIFHYITKWRSQKTLTAADERTLAELWETANRMEQRIHGLERILDAEVPDWRNRT
ncbi:MAG: envelope stress response membrane protein PspB [Rhodospirillales bacterium]